MPYRRVYRRRRIPRRRRRIYRRRAGPRRRRRYRKYSIRKMPMIFPDRVVVPLLYRVRYNPTDVSGTFYSYYNLNAPHTTKPLGWSQWTAFYGHYHISASSIKVDAVLSGTEGGVVYLYPSHANSPATNETDVSFQPYCRKLTIGNPTTNTTRNRISNYMTVAKIFGQRPNGINWSSSVSSTPASTYIAYWYLAGYALDGTWDSAQFVVTLVYKCHFYRRSILTATS